MGYVAEIWYIWKSRNQYHVVNPQKVPCADCTWPCDPVVVGEGCICRC
ncbi:uncharacterized protein LOC110229861 [Arabidopsis lyrata subsp. lyrata]|nr:uncharacterized protein LOC110229861 [Arabidopsis lyrata subsp. lyrata]|eukprot:XP_020886581.1 uncharacterized protein LOC110229861 [Arabidopsis lyrata subsp. lyrata]